MGRECCLYPTRAYLEILDDAVDIVMQREIQRSSRRTDWCDSGRSALRRHLLAVVVVAVQARSSALTDRRARILDVTPFAGLASYHTVLPPPPHPPGTQGVS